MKKFFVFLFFPVLCFSQTNFDKVERAIKQIFGEIKTTKEEEIDRVSITAIITNSQSLARLKYILARDRIRDATRRVLNRKSKENSS